MSTPKKRQLIKRSSEEEGNGRYHRAFLDRLFGDRYEIYTIKVQDLRNERVQQNVTHLLQDKGLSLAFMNAEKLDLVWFYDYPGWMRFASEMGIVITPHPKIAKRLTTITRKAYLHVVIDPDIEGSHVLYDPYQPVRTDGELDWNDPHLRVSEISRAEFSDYSVGDKVVINGEEKVLTAKDIEKFLDGANVISYELLDRMMTFARPYALAHQKDMVDIGEINEAIVQRGGGQFRLLFELGLIKGDTIFSTREKMGGYDVLYSPDNLKPELKSTKYAYCLFESHGDHSHDERRMRVYTDDQTMSWLGDFIYPNEVLYDALSEHVTKIRDDLEENRIPPFFTRHELLDDEYITIDRFQGQALLFEKRGLGVNNSVYLMNKIIGGIVNQLTRRSRPRWPIPCAVRAHVGTDSWLHMQQRDPADWPNGKGFTPRGSIWYDEVTHRMIYDDVDFLEAYERHGGWDLDDNAIYHAREINGRKQWVVVRNPNSFGEYDLKDYIPDTFSPSWVMNDGTVIEWPKVDAEQAPPTIDNLNDVQYKYEDGLKGEAVMPRTYTRSFVDDAINTGIKFFGLFGRWVNAHIIYADATGGYRKKQLATTEDVVDASTQGQSDKAAQEIEDDTEECYQEIVELGYAVDKTLWEQRSGIMPVPDGMTFKRGAFTVAVGHHKRLVETYVRLIRDVVKKVRDRLPQELFELGKLRHAEVENLYNTLLKLVRDQHPELEQEQDESRASFYGRINDAVVPKLNLLAASLSVANETDPLFERHNIMMSLARRCYNSSTGGNDTMLFQVSNDEKSNQTMFEFYLQAIEFFGLNEDEFERFVPCPIGSESCRGETHVTNRVDYQHLLSYGSGCVNC